MALERSTSGEQAWLGVFEAEHVLWLPVFYFFAFSPPGPAVSAGVAVLLSLRAFVSARPDRILKTGIGLCFLPSEPGLWFYHAVLLFVVMGMLVRQELRVDRTTRLLFLWATWCLVSYLFSQRFGLNGLSIWIYALTFWSSVLGFIVAANSQIEGAVRRSIGRFLLGCLVIQAGFAGWVALAYYSENASVRIADWGFGSTYVSLPFLYVVGISLAAGPWIRALVFRGRPRRRTEAVKPLMLLTLLTGALVITGSKTVIFSYAISVGVGLGLPVLFVALYRRMRLLAVVSLGAALSIGGVWGAWHLIHDLYGTGYLKTWIVDDTGPGGYAVNHKYVFLERAFDEIPNAYDSWVLGTGPGTVGSRASNIRAYDTMYKTDAKLEMISRVLPAYTSPPARAYFSDLYQEGFATTSTYRSATLSQPFSSLISLLVETGVGGFLVFAGVLFHLMRIGLQVGRDHPDRAAQGLGLATYSVTLCLAILALFDTYLERPTMMTAYWILVGMTAQSLRQARVAK